MKIVVFGNTGSGKTTVIGHLRRLLDFEVIAIDDCRRLVSDASWLGEKASVELFIDRITPDKNQIIECVGVGTTADALANKLQVNNEWIMCMTILASADICKSRVKNRPQSVPFPTDYQTLDDFIERTQVLFQNGCLKKLPFNPHVTQFFYEHNTDLGHPRQIAQNIAFLASGEYKKKLNSADLSVNDMLSDKIQDYYSNDYYTFQSRVNKQNDNIAADQKKIGQFLQSLSLSGSVLDVGSGNAQWFNFMSSQVTSYYAVDVNQTALSLLPQDPKIKALKGNIFDENEVDLKQLKLDIALLSFFISHFADEAIRLLFYKLQSIEEVIIIDSFWSQPQKNKHLIKDIKYVRRNTKSSVRIAMPKRFFERDDIDKILDHAGFDIINFDIGFYWFVAFARKRRKA